MIRLIVRVVEFSRHRAIIVVGAIILVAAVAGISAAHRLAIDTDLGKLISRDLPWQKTAAELDREFPQNDDLLVTVLDGATPDQTADAASALAARLAAQPGRFRDVREPGGGTFFRQNGLLFLPRNEVEKFSDDLISAQPLIGTLAADPNLRGVFSALDLLAQGGLNGATDSAVLDPPIDAVAAAVEAAAIGRYAPVSWQNLFSGRKPGPRELRRFVLTRPVLDYNAVQPGQRAVDAIRAAARAERLAPGRGVRVRITGPVALTDDQFSALSEGAGWTTLLPVLLLCFWLLLGLRSLRTVAAILATLIVGLVLCAAFATLAIGPFNPISVAFAPLFVGIAIDFGIQFGVRHVAELCAAPPPDALRRTALGVGRPLGVAAGATAVGFFAFVPTAYSGVSDLGKIAGVGMLLALTLNLTFLPALLSLLHPRGRPEAASLPWAAAVDRFLLQRRPWVLGATAVLAAISAVAVTRLRFDFNPLHLQDQKAESVQTLFDLMADPDTTPYTIKALAPSPAEARALSGRLERLPEVAQVLTLESMIPDDQSAKLDILADARSLLSPTLWPPVIKPPPAPTEVLAAASACAADMAQLGARGDRAAARLAAALRDARARGDSVLPALAANLSDGIRRRLDDLRLALQAVPVSLATLPPEIRRDWIGRSGKWCVAIFPRGDARDNKVLRRFADAVRRVAPNATGDAVTIQESARTVTGAFATAGLGAAAAITVLLLVVLRRLRDIASVLAPLLLAGLLTLATAVLAGLPLNFANIITLPLLLGIGVAFDIYFVMRWRAREGSLLQSSTARAVLFSALTTGTAFGSLALSRAPGLAEMGKLLLIALAYTLLCTLFVLPALLGPPAKASAGESDA